MSLALVHQYQDPADTSAGTSDWPDAPTPWRMVFGLSELARIDDARGHAVTICRREVAARIVAAINSQSNEASNGN